jgi:hypothetical protein
MTLASGMVDLETSVTVPVMVARSPCPSSNTGRAKKNKQHKDLQTVFSIVAAILSLSLNERNGPLISNGCLFYSGRKKSKCYAAQTF